MNAISPNGIAAPASAPAPATAPPPVDQFRDDVFLHVVNNGSMSGWPITFVRHEREITAYPETIAGAPGWSSLDQAITGAGQLSRDRRHPVAIVAGGPDGAAYTAAKLLVRGDHVTVSTKDLGSSTWVTSPGTGLEQPSGEALDLQRNLKWSDQPGIASFSRIGSAGRVVGLVTFRDGWGSQPKPSLQVAIADVVLDG